MLIQAFLILATLGLLVLLLQKRGAARTRAWKRLILVALVCIAIVSIMNPGMTSLVANLVGVGRGTDLLLYALTAVLLFYVVVGFYLKFRDVERQLTVVARRHTLDEALRRSPAPPEQRRSG